MALLSSSRGLCRKNRKMEISFWWPHTFPFFTPQWWDDRGAVYTRLCTVWKPAQMSMEIWLPANTLDSKTSLHLRPCRRQPAPRCLQHRCICMSRCVSLSTISDIVALLRFLRSGKWLVDSSVLHFLPSPEQWWQGGERLFTREVPPLLSPRIQTVGISLASFPRLSRSQQKKKKLRSHTRIR